MAEIQRQLHLSKPRSEAIANLAVGALVGGMIAGPVGAVVGAATGALVEKGPSETNPQPKETGRVGRTENPRTARKRDGNRAAPKSR